MTSISKFPSNIVVSFKYTNFTFYINDTTRYLIEHYDVSNFLFELIFMFFDPDNPIVKRCAEGIAVEGQPKLALVYYHQAWNEAANSEERFIAAHYLARVQATVAEKLKWDQVALSEAITVDKDYIKLAFPSLYLNIGKCFEDMADFVQSEQNYLVGLSYANLLTDDGYINMIKSGLERGIERVLACKK